MVGLAGLYKRNVHVRMGWSELACWFGCGRAALTGVGTTCSGAHEKIVGFYGDMATSYKPNPAIVSEEVTEVLWAVAPTDLYFYYVLSEDGAHAVPIANPAFGKAPKGDQLPQRLGSPAYKRNVHVRMGWSELGLQLVFSGAVSKLVGKLGEPSVDAGGAPTWPDVDPDAYKDAHTAVVQIGNAELLSSFNARFPAPAPGDDDSDGGGGGSGGNGGGGGGSGGSGEDDDDDYDEDYEDPTQPIWVSSGYLYTYIYALASHIYIYMPWPAIYTYMCIGQPHIHTYMPWPAIHTMDGDSRFLFGI